MADKAKQEWKFKPGDHVVCVEEAPPLLRSILYVVAEVDNFGCVRIEGSTPWFLPGVFEISDGSLGSLPPEPLDYPALGSDIGRTVESKQAAYGDSFGKSGRVLRELYPDGIPLAKLDDALTIVRVVDKLFRIATDRDALGESPWRDIAGYSLLAVARQAAEKSGGTGCRRHSKRSPPMERAPTLTPRPWPSRR